MLKDTLKQKVNDMIAPNRIKVTMRALVAIITMSGLWLWLCI